MWRRSLALRCPAATAALERLRGSAAGGPLTVGAVLDALQAHPARADVAAAALPRLTEADQEAADSAAVAARHAVLVDAFRAHGSQSVAAAEHCCRAVANAALVPSAAALPDGEAPADEAEHCATRLRAAGAVGLVVSALQRGPALSPKGRAWACAALQNLVLLDDGAAAEAAAAGADVAVAAVLRQALSATEAEPMAVLTDAPTRAVVEGALAALARLLSLQLDGNADADVAFRYERCPRDVAAAIGLALGRCTAAAAAAVREHGEAAFSAAVAPALVELEHRAWEALRLVAAGGEANGEILLQALAAADGTTNAGGAAGRRILARWLSTAQGAPVAAPAGAAAGSPEVLGHQVLLAGVGVLTELTAPRHETVAAPGETAAFPDADADMEAAETDGGAFPDRTAEAEGPAATAEALRRHAAAAVATHEVTTAVVSLLARRDAAPTPTVPVPAATPALLGLLANLAESDPAAASANTLTVVRPLLAAADEETAAPVAEKALAVLWNALNHKTGAEAWAVLQLTPLAEAAQRHPAQGVRDMAEKLYRKAVAVVEAPRVVRRDGTVGPKGQQ